MDLKEKSLIEVAKQVEALEVKYLELHKNEIPIFNPIESGLQSVKCSLDKLSEKSKKKKQWVDIV